MYYIINKGTTNEQINSTMKNNAFFLTLQIVIFFGLKFYMVNNFNVSEQCFAFYCWKKLCQ